MENIEPITNPRHILELEPIYYTFKDKLISASIHSTVNNMQIYPYGSQELINLVPNIICAIKDLYNIVDEKRCGNQTIIETNYLRLNSASIFDAKLEALDGCPVIVGAGGYTIKPALTISDNKTVVSGMRAKLKRLTVVSNGKPNLIAEQVEQNFPELIYNYGDKKAINYHDLCLYLLSSLNEI